MIGALIGLVLGCSAPVFCPPAPLVGGGAPANAPGLPVLDIGRPPLAAPLVLADGGVLGFERVGGTVKPLQPLTEGETYRLRHACLDRIHEETITAAPARPLPTRTGTLTVSQSGRKVVAAAGGSACFTEVDAAFAQLRVEPDPALIPFLSVVSWRLEIDGKIAWATRGVGGVAADGAVTPSVLSRRLNLVHAACGGSQDADPGIAPGYHVARLYAELSGGDKLEPAETTFTLECGTGCGCGASAPGLFAVLAVGGFVRRRFR